jgi:hypothetical protein
VLIDAKTIGVKKGQIAGMGNMEPWGWFFSCLLLWIVGFPFYVAKRGEFKKANAVVPPQPESKKPSTSSESIAQLEKLAQLKEKGLITEEEFAKKKKELLGLV